MVASIPVLFDNGPSDTVVAAALNLPGLGVDNDNFCDIHGNLKILFSCCLPNAFAFNTLKLFCSVCFFFIECLMKERLCVEFIVNREILIRVWV